MNDRLLLAPSPSMDSTNSGRRANILPALDSFVLDPRAILAAINRNRWAILAIVAGSLLIGLLSILLAKPIYQATASVQIDQQIAKVLGTEDSDQFQVSGDADRFLQTQLDVLKSRDLAEKVADNLRLTNDDRALKALGIEVSEEEGRNRSRLRDKALGAVQKALSVTLPRLSRVAQVSVESGDPLLSARVANAYVDAYINGNLQRKFDQSAYSRKFLEDQLGQTRIKLESSERNMVNFARQAGLIEIESASPEGGSSGASQSLVTADLVQLNQSFAAAKATRIAAEQQWNQAQLTPLMSLPEVLANTAVQSMTQELAKARVDARELRERLKEDHPTVRQKEAVITALANELQKQASSVKNSIRDRYLVAQKQEQSFSATVAGLKGSTLSERDRSIQYNILRREVDTNRALYDALLQRFKEVSAEAGVTTNNISIIDIAVPPKAPASPRPSLNMALALLLGLAGAGAWVYGREQLTDSVRTPDDVEKRVGLPLLGVMPMVKQDQTPQQELQNPKSPFSEAIHALRTSLELATTDGVPRSLAFTSTRPSEGKSTLTFALGREFALAGKRVVVIDADMRAPSLHRISGVLNKSGLSQVLAKQIEINAGVLRTDVEGLDIIPSGPLPPDPTLLLNGTRLADVVAVLAEKYDLILIDCPPVLGLADALQIGSQVEASLMVVEANDTRFSNIRTALGRLQDNRVHLLGAILSKFDAARFGYGEYYGYYYAHYGSK